MNDIPKPLDSTAIEVEAQPKFAQILSEKEIIRGGEASHVSTPKEILDTKLHSQSALGLLLQSLHEPTNEDGREAKEYRLPVPFKDIDLLLTTRPIIINTERDLQEHLSYMKDKRESEIPIFLRIHKKNLLPNCIFDPYRHPEDYVDILITDEVETITSMVFTLALDDREQAREIFKVKPQVLYLDFQESHVEADSQERFRAAYSSNILLTGPAGCGKSSSLLYAALVLQMWAKETKIPLVVFYVNTDEDFDHEEEIRAKFGNYVKEGFPFPGLET